jgi:inhibitor of KinA
VTVRQPQVSPFGDAALLVAWPELIDPALNELVHVLAELIRAERRAGAPWHPPVPAYASVLAPYDPLSMSAAEAEARLGQLLGEVWAGEPAATQDLPLLEIPVQYGGQDGPDLAEVAQRTGLSAAEVVGLHTAPTYRAYLLGFAPGFAYLGTLPPELHLPRRATPRQRVPAGSVGIAAAQTAVYPLSTAGGWHLLGRTEMRLWDIERDPPTLIRPGQQVRFVALGS